MKLTTHTPLQLRHQDERQYRRRLVSEPVSCSFGHHEWRAYLTDISASGAFIESVELPPVGGHVMLDFTLPFRERGIRVRFGLRSVVVRTHQEDDESHVLCPHGFSVRFLELTKKERLCLKAFAHAVAHPSQIVQYEA